MNSDVMCNCVCICFYRIIWCVVCGHPHTPSAQAQDTDMHEKPTRYKPRLDYDTKIVALVGMFSYIEVHVNEASGA